MSWYKEDDKYIYCNDLKRLCSELELLKTSGYGCNSVIYNYKLKELLKVYKREMSLSKKLDLDSVKYLKTNSLIMPNKILLVKGAYYGHTMKKCDGKMIGFLNGKTNLDEFLKSFEPISEDIKLLSKYKFFHSDINVLNIIYDNKTKLSNVIDCDSIIRYPKNSQELITIGSFKDLNNTVLEAISKIPSYIETDNKSLECMKKIIDNKVYFDESFEEFFRSLIQILENEVDKEITTVNDFRKALTLSKN